MKTKIILLSMLVFSICNTSLAQKKDTSTLHFDFNRYTAGPLNGQDGWTSVKNLTSNDITITKTNSFDGSNILSQTAFGAQVYVNGSRSIKNIFNKTGFSDSNATYVISFDVIQNYWGIQFYIGTDVNSDGIIAPNNSNEVALRTEFRTEGTGTGFSYSPAGTSSLDTLVNTYNWTNVRIVIRSLKNGGFADFYALDKVTGKTRKKLNVALGINYSGSGKINPNNWNIMGLSFQTSDAFIDNLKFEKIVNVVKDTATLLLDFNAYTVGNLNGQDNWTTVKNLTNNDIEIVSNFGPDGSKALTQTTGGPQVYVSGSRSISNIFNNSGFKDSNSRYVFSFDVVKNFWGIRFIVGTDANSDGKIAYIDNTEVAISTEFRSQGTGIGTFTSPNGNIGTDTLVNSLNWTNVKIILYDMRAGGLADLYSYDYVTKKTRVLRKIPLGLSYAASGKSNPSNWNIFGLDFQTGDAKMDNVKFEKISYKPCTSTKQDDVKTACGSYKWIDGIVYTASNTTATKTYKNVYNCDSTINLKLTINNVNTATTNTNNTITAVEDNATYQWIDCSNKSIISGATNKTYTTVANGIFAVIVTKNGCSDTSDCVNLSSVGVKANVNNSTISIYPNPNQGKFIISNSKSSKITITDAVGRNLAFTQSGFGSNSIEITLSNSVSNGIYYLNSTTADGKKSAQEIIIYK